MVFSRVFDTWLILIFLRWNRAAACFLSVQRGAACWFLLKLCVSYTYIYLTYLYTSRHEQDDSYIYIHLYTYI